jgi:hypothetical protein
MLPSAGFEVSRVGAAPGVSTVRPNDLVEWLRDAQHAQPNGALSRRWTKEHQ